jgi:rare lipoprotein A
VKVSIDDRGPHVKGRIIDLSAAAAHALGMKKEGVVQVRLEAFKNDQASG